MNQIERFKLANDIMTKEIALEKDFSNFEKIGVFPEQKQSFEDKIVQNKVKIKVLEWFKTIETDDEVYKFSKYIKLYLDATPRIWFVLTDKILSERYNNVLSSYSELNAETNRKFRELVSPYCDIEGLESMWTCLNDRSSRDIGDPEAYANATISNLTEILDFLKSDKMKKLNAYIENYIDDMIKYAKESGY